MSQACCEVAVFFAVLLRYLIFLEPKKMALDPGRQIDTQLCHPVQLTEVELVVFRLIGLEQCLLDLEQNMVLVLVAHALARLSQLLQAELQAVGKLMLHRDACTVVLVLPTEASLL